MLIKSQVVLLGEVIFSKVHAVLMDARLIPRVLYQTSFEHCRPMAEGLYSLTVNYRLPLILGANLVLTALSYLLALSLRFDFQAEVFININRLYFPLALLVLYRSAIYSYLELNKGYWRYTSTHEIVELFKAHLLSSLLLAATLGLAHIPSYPRSVVIIEFALSILLAAGLRLGTRILCENWLSHKWHNNEEGRNDTIILGAGDSGHLLVKYLQSHLRIPYLPIAVLDDSERLRNSSVYGVKVLGSLASLADHLELYSTIKTVICAIPSLTKSRVREIEQTCLQYGVSLKKLQTFEDIACTDIPANEQLTSIEDLLERDSQVAHEEEISQVLSGKRILITGAGGSIGSELVRQILKFKPASIAMLDHSEFNLYSAQREFSVNHVEIEKKFILASITNNARLQRVFEDTRPEIVFHAAAYKHVPLMEENCYEAFVNNVIGTKNLLEMAEKHLVSRFVFISSDKAVDPSSIMGFSKRLAEMLVVRYGKFGKNGKRNLSQQDSAIVRFGNVINSAGSVVPLFKEQILKGGPITVTHPDMERYFMSTSEAVRLVLTAQSLGHSGEIYVLDMGAPIKIVDVAKKMRALYGRSDIPIVFTGIRAGEKLSERLNADNEDILPTRFSKVQQLQVKTNPEHYSIAEWVLAIESKLSLLTEQELAQEMKEFVAGKINLRDREISSSQTKQPRVQFDIIGSW